jgi:CRISPR-associated endonuclease/helicase Cas3
LVLEGRLSEQIADRIRTDWQAGRVVLVCLNRIADAQRVYRLLRDTLTLKPDDEIVLLHGRFNGQDRARKEAVLMSRAGVGRADRRPFICVATQVVEVSLNVDFDTLYTDPAPLEALLQRFGRVNRGRGAGSPLLPVHVLTQPDAPAAQKPYLPYDAPMVERSVEVLRRYCDGGPIDEALVTTMLGEIYSGDLLAQWEQEYAASALTFCRDILQGMEAFKSGDAHEFYRLFDSTEVLPIGALDAYLDAREQRGYLEASQYLVGVSYALYREFDDYGLIVHARDLEDDYADHIRVVYDAEYGLDIDGARQQAKGERGAVPAEWE